MQSFELSDKKAERKMSINISYTFARYVFFAFNVLFWILGCGSLGIGVWLYLVKTEYLSLAPASYGALSAAGLCIAAGATVIVIGFVGCCGAWIQSRCLLLTYFVFVLLVFVVEITAGSLGFLYREEVTEVIRNELHLHINDPFVSHTGRDTNGMKITWDKMQKQFQCCGVDSYTDWFKKPRWPRNDWVPDSCCDPSKFTGDHVDMANCGKLADPNLLYTQGCYIAFSHWLLEHMHIVGVVGLLFAFIQLFGLVSSMLLFCGLGRRSQRYIAVKR